MNKPVPSSSSRAFSTIPVTKKCSRCKVEAPLAHKFCITCGQSFASSNLKKLQPKKTVRVPPIELQQRFGESIPTKKRTRKPFKNPLSSESAPYDMIIAGLKSCQKTVSPEKVYADWSKSIVLEQVNAIGFEELDRSQLSLRASRSAPSVNNAHIQRLPSISSLYKHLHRNEVINVSYTDQSRYLHRPVQVIKDAPNEDAFLSGYAAMLSTTDSRPATSDSKAWLWGNNRSTEMGDESVGGMGDSADSVQKDDPISILANLSPERDGAQEGIRTEDDASSVLSDENWDDNDLGSVMSDEASIVHTEGLTALEDMRAFYLQSESMRDLTRGGGSEDEEWNGNGNREGGAGRYDGTLADLAADDRSISSQLNRVKNPVVEREDEAFSAHLDSYMNQVESNREALESRRLQRLEAIEADEGLAGNENWDDNDLGSVMSDEASIVHTEGLTALEDMRAFYLQSESMRDLTRAGRGGEHNGDNGGEGAMYDNSGTLTDPPTYADGTHADLAVDDRSISSQLNRVKNPVVEREDEAFSAHLDSYMNQVESNREALESRRLQRLEAIEADEGLTCESSNLASPAAPRFRRELSTVSAGTAFNDPHSPSNDQSLNLVAASAGEAEAAKARDMSEYEDSINKDSLVEEMKQLEDRMRNREQLRRAVIEDQEDMLFFSPFTLLAPLDDEDDCVGPENASQGGGGAPIPHGAFESLQHEQHVIAVEQDLSGLAALSRKISHLSVSREDMIRRRHRHLHAGLPSVAEGGEDVDEEDNGDWMFDLIERDERRNASNVQRKLQLNQQWLSVVPSIAYGHTEDPKWTSDKYRVTAPQDRVSMDHVAGSHLVPSQVVAVDDHQSLVLALPAIPDALDEFNANVLTSKIYMDSHRNIKVITPALEVDLRISVEAMTPEEVIKLARALSTAERVKAHADGVEDWVKAVVKAFFEKAKRSRAEASAMVSVALHKAAEIESFFSQQIREFKEEISSQGGKGMHSFHAQDDLRAISDQANDALRDCSEEVDRLQKRENELVKQLRDEEFSMMEAIKAWRMRHAQVVTKLVVNMARLDKFLTSGGQR